MNNLESFKAKMRREHFRAFNIEFVSGATILIDIDTEVLFPRSRPELAIVFTRDGLQHEFEQTAIARLIEVT
jgi:hypothetical protein